MPFRLLQLCHKFKINIIDTICPLNLVSFRESQFQSVQNISNLVEG